MTQLAAGLSNNKLDICAHLIFPYKWQPHNLVWSCIQRCWSSANNTGNNNCMPSKLNTEMHSCLCNPELNLYTRIQMPKTMAPMVKPVNTFLPRRCLKFFCHRTSSVLRIKSSCSLVRLSFFGSMRLANSASPGEFVSAMFLGHQRDYFAEGQLRKLGERVSNRQCEFLPLLSLRN